MADQEETTPDLAIRKLEFEERKWCEELELRKRELDLEEKKAKRSDWSNPLLLAISGAVVAAIANLIVTVINGQNQANTEQIKAEQALVLSAIDTDAEAAEKNLKFLVDAGLITDPDRRASILEYYEGIETGDGPTLNPGPRVTTSSQAVPIRELDPASAASRVATRVGVLNVGDSPRCSAFQVGLDEILTSSFCLEADDLATAQFVANEVSTRIANVSKQQKFEEIGGDNLDFALLKLSRSLRGPGLTLASQPPNPGDRVLVVHGSPQTEGFEMSATGTDRFCIVDTVGENTFGYTCRAGGGSSGGAVMTIDGSRVIGIAAFAAQDRSIAIRADKVAEALGR